MPIKRSAMFIVGQLNIKLFAMKGFSQIPDFKVVISCRSFVFSSVSLRKPSAWFSWILARNLTWFCKATNKLFVNWSSICVWPQSFVGTLNVYEQCESFALVLCPSVTHNMANSRHMRSTDIAMLYSTLRVPLPLTVNLVSHSV